MARKHEGHYQKLLLDCLRSAAAWTFNIHGHSGQKAGVPDLYVAHPIWRGWLEIKVDDHPLEPKQREEARRLIERQDVVYVIRVDSEDDWMIVEEPAVKKADRDLWGLARSGIQRDGYPRVGQKLVDIGPCSLLKGGGKDVLESLRDAGAY